MEAQNETVNVWNPAGYILEANSRSIYNNKSKDNNKNTITILIIIILIIMRITIIITIKIIKLFVTIRPNHYNQNKNNRPFSLIRIFCQDKKM